MVFIEFNKNKVLSCFLNLNTLIFSISNQTQIETLVLLMCFAISDSSCLIYNGVAYFGGCLDLFDQIETLKLLNIFDRGSSCLFPVAYKKWVYCFHR